MKTKKIGIPRYLFYNSEKTFVKNYFEYLGYVVILSPKTLANKHNLNSRCKVYKNYLEHLLFLKDKCDIIIIPYSARDTCPFIENTPNIIYFGQIKTVYFNIDKPMQIIKETIKFQKNIPKIIISYILAKQDYLKKKKRDNLLVLEKLNSIAKSVLIVSNHCSNYYIPKKVMPNINIIYSNQLSKKVVLDYANNYSKDIHPEFIKLMIGSVYYCYKAVDKIIIINNKDCCYTIHKYIKYFPKNIKKKITIINI